MGCLDPGVGLGLSRGSGHADGICEPTCSESEKQQPKISFGWSIDRTADIIIIMVYSQYPHMIIFPNTIILPLPISISIIFQYPQL